MMVVRLKNTSAINILTGDNVYLRENVERTRRLISCWPIRPPGFFTAFEWIRQMMATEKSEFLHCP